MMIGEYGLSRVRKIIGYKLKHHNALEDAKAAGQVIISAIETTGLNVDAWLKRVRQPIDPENSSTGPAINREGNPEGELFGEVMVFTGAMEMPRKEAANIAASIGCKVDSGITRKTTLLVVGDQDVKKSDEVT